MRNYRHIEVRPIAGALGAELHGVDMSRDLEDDVVAEVRQAFLDHLVIFLRDQKVTPQQNVAFARKFGELIKYPQLDGLPEAPFITAVVKLENERHNFGGLWHSDTTYLEIPPMGSMLLAREVPPFGGDTVFANQYMAYEALSDGLKAVLDGLIGVSSSTKAEVSKTREHLERTHVAHQGMDRAGEPGAAGVPMGAPGAARVHLPLPLGDRLARLLGQPLRDAQRDQRLSRSSAGHASDHVGGRQTEIERTTSP
jgi:alpha-ketoglutarate-dependent taurine dioxygenase